MGFSSGGYNFEVAALSKKATRGKTTADTIVYVGTNAPLGDPDVDNTALARFVREPVRKRIGQSIAIRKRTIKR